MLVKRDPDSACTIVNEFICARLAIGLGLPVPMGDAGMLDNVRAWVSAEIALDGGVIPPDADIERAAHAAPGDLAGICVFDVWVSNEDRTEENVLYHPTIGLWAIDHERALGGTLTLHPEHLEAVSHTSSPWTLIAPERLDANQLRGWASRVRNLDPRMIAAAVQEASARRLIATAAQRDAIIDFLSVRSRNIEYLLKASIGEDNLPWLTEPRVGS
ncbi:hypothetical protein IDH50_06840 [Aeromicrobium tamlense]|uniref:HipA-like kinase domain-containing protein n=1 Tax=Aeromicrobium tamlense TaxID=375541 RepID=A0A8I0FTI0_9ACTN|nr:HipA family kinase [Aeromicrobium tamlense]MBD1269939.1 hypothetical protein [Aeromicrobium tamlense]NYI39404.1 hypothetical protein [Aeromicrobium tamlense]